MYVIDVSSNNGIPNFKALAKQGVRAVYIKATEGLTYINPQFEEQWKRADAAGLIVGAYHFAHEDLKHDAAAEADHFLNTCRKVHRQSGNAFRIGNLIPVLDFEVGSPGKLYSRWRDAFQLEIKKQTHHRSMLYTYPAFNSWMKPLRNDLACLWIANYGVQHPSLPMGYRTWDLWQFNDKKKFKNGFGKRIFLDASILPHPTHLDKLRCHING